MEPPQHSRELIIQLMEECFGRHKATLLIDEAVAGLALGVRSSYRYEEVQQMLLFLSREPGLIGIAARFATQRLPQRWPVLDA